MIHTLGHYLYVWTVVSTCAVTVWCVYDTIQRKRRTTRVLDYVMASIDKIEVAPQYGIAAGEADGEVTLLHFDFTIDKADAKRRGWIQESRFTIEAANDADAIEQLIARGRA